MSEYKQEIKYAVVAIRISSLKQGLEGDSPEHQQEQIEIFAKTKNITIKKIFYFMESASKEQQPVQEAIDYCKNPKNHIHFFIIKSIDRFTRGGSYFYDLLKMQLENHKVKLLDLYGVIGTQEVNTLEHLGMRYKWSVYNPSKKTEILEAERAKDEIRNIMSRLIGSEIRYDRLGYHVRQAPIGYVNEKVETEHGKRVILAPHPIESVWIKRIFVLRCNGTMTDDQIIDEVNNLGFQTRISFLRNPKNKIEIIGERGGNKLHKKYLYKYLRNPIYAGINCDKWTQGKAIKSKFDGLVSFDTFNTANRGKVIILNDNDEITIVKGKNKLVNYRLHPNPLYPYKRYVLCPICKHPFYGSASRGKLGTHYPSYHCNKRGHYFRVPLKEFEGTIADYLKKVQLKPEYLDLLKTVIIEKMKKRMIDIKSDGTKIDKQIADLKTSQHTLLIKIKYLSSETALRYMESELSKIDAKICELEMAKKESILPKFNEAKFKVYLDKYLKHLDIRSLILGIKDPFNRAMAFGHLFEETPTYKEITSGETKLANIFRYIN